MMPTRQKKTKMVDALFAITPHLSPVRPGRSNLVFSPLSLQVVLSLVAAGASSPAADQILSLLRSDSIDDLNAVSSNLISKVLAVDTSNSSVPSYYFDSHPPDISFVNGIWIHDGLSLKHSFKQVVDNVYQADLFPSDFATKSEEIESQVNSWAADKTHGLIRDVIEPGSLTEVDRLILVNALYFKASWDEIYFNESATKDNDFHLLDGTSVKVPFMTNNGRSSLLIGIFDDFKVLRLDYESKTATQFCMYIILPDSVDGLAALEARVESEPDFIERHRPPSYVDVEEFRIPKFKISFKFSATDILKQFGVTLPFEAGYLSEMVEDSGEDLCVSEIHQKALIEVNEKGTLAAAVTMGKCVATSFKPPPKRRRTDFVADHPFMFVIREEDSGAVLFLGHVINPQNSGGE